MTKNKEFFRYTVVLNVLGILLMFMYSGLQNDQINIIQTFSGWTTTATQAPMTVGNFVCIALTFLYGTWFIKYGVRKTMIPVMLVAAAGCLGIVAANGLASVSGGVVGSGEGVVGNYALFYVSLFVVRCACMIFQMGGFMLVANWFIRYRGRVMGIVTLGSPLFSVVGTAVMTNFITNYLGGDYRPFYIGIAVIIVAIVVVLGVGLKDTPEEAGLYPDGSDSAPKSEGGIEEVNLTVGQVLSEKRAWLLIVSYGAFVFIINACMGSMVVRYMALAPAGSENPMVVWIEALTWLAMGAIAGIPMSYVFGWIDDKFGTINASLVLGLCELIPVLSLMLQPEGGSAPLMVLWGFGVACMTGGVPTLHPCSIGYAYRRQEYQAANRIIMSIQLIPSAVAAMMMTVLISSGQSMLAYGILLAIIAVGMIATLAMKSIPDASLADRDYANKKK